MKFYMVVKTWRPWPELYKKFVAVSKGPLMLIPFLQTCRTGFVLTDTLTALWNQVNSHLIHRTFV